jgi:L-cystine uptake protein TcyP (sodium:dicarboxylate symporter family)
MDVVATVDVAVTVAGTVAVVVSVNTVAVVVVSSGRIAGAPGGTRTSATMIVQAMTKILIAPCLFKTVLSNCWV